MKLNRYHILGIGVAVILAFIVLLWPSPSVVIPVENEERIEELEDRIESEKETIKTKDYEIIKGHDHIDRLDYKQRDSLRAILNPS